jgi:hypothetical protein
MERVRRQIAEWTLQGLPESPAARAASVFAIAVVPGAWAIWLAWRLLRSGIDAWAPPSAG